LKRGWTLQELLIVIAIIGALAGIGFPMIGRFKKTAQRATCLNALRGLGVAVEGYTSDHQGFLPDLKMGRGSKTGGDNVLEVELLDYVDDPMAFKCPADDEEFEKTGSSYHWNSLISGMPQTRVTIFGMESDSDGIPLIADKEAFHGEEEGTNFLFTDQSAGKRLNMEVRSR
jgi:prepilin-type N-terminal cleavage/methylation domain-containing protein